jgi:hypothetical protein
MTRWTRLRICTTFQPMSTGYSSQSMIPHKPHIHSRTMQVYGQVQCVSREVSNNHGIRAKTNVLYGYVTKSSWQCLGLTTVDILSSGMSRLGNFKWWTGTLCVDVEFSLFFNTRDWVLIETYCANEFQFVQLVPDFSDRFRDA